MYVNAAHGVSPAASRAAVDQATAAGPLLQVTSIADYKSTLSSRIGQVLALFGPLLGLSILMALLGAVLGVALGASFGLAMVHAFITSAGSGVVSVPYAQIAVYVLAGAGAGLLAAVLQAAGRRAPVVAAMADA